MNNCGCIGDVNPLPKMSLVHIFKLQYAGNISICTKCFIVFLQLLHSFFFFFFFFFFFYRVHFGYLL